MVAVTTTSFSLSPYHAGIAKAEVIDYTTKTGREHYRAATQSLESNGYNLTANDCFALLNAFRERASSMGWDREKGVLDIPDTNGQVHNVVEHYAMLTLKDVEKSEIGHMADDSRQAQDSYMAYQCLYNSLTREARSQMSLLSDKYQIEIKSGERSMDVPSGVLYLKILIGRARMDSTASAIALRAKISNLHVTISTYLFDIVKFNNHVRQIVNDLAARGEIAPDLLDHLIRAYRTTPDSTFADYIIRRQDAYEEGLKITAEQLMEGAENKYSALLATERWNQKTPAESKIIMLEAEVRSLKSGKRNTPTGGDKNGTNKWSRKKQNTSKDTPKIQSTRPDWMVKSIPPSKSNTSETKQWGRNTYWFCGGLTGGHCEKWRCHKGSECKASSFEAKSKLGTLKDNKPKDQNKTNSPPTESINASHKKVRFNSALIAQMEQTKTLLAEMDLL